MLGRVFVAVLACTIVTSSNTLTTRPRLRTACISVSNLPQVTGILDVRRVEANHADLNAADFVLLDGNQNEPARKQLVTFRDTNLGVALIVAVDASGSMKGRPLTAIQNGLVRLVDRKRSQDKVAVLSFADDTRWEAKWDSNATELKDSFKNLRGRGNYTRLYDAIAFALSELSRASSEHADFPLRQSILVISDGHDEGSQATIADLETKIKASKVRIDVVGLAHSPLWFGILRQISQDGFGEFRVAHTPEDLETMLGSGIDGLLSMPTIEFNDTKLSADGATHTLAVEYTPSGVRNDFVVKLPKKFFSTRNLILVSVSAVLLLLTFLFLFRFSHKQQVRQPMPLPTADSNDPVPATTSAPARKAATRAATVAESGPTFRGFTVETAPSIRYTEAVPLAPASPPEKPARQATVFASAQKPGTKLGLRAISGPYAGHVFETGAEEFWIGSAANNHLCLSADPGASGNHACIRTESEFFRIYDNDSLNNTWVNGHAIGREVTLIGPGDRVRIGQSEFLLEAHA